MPQTVREVMTTDLVTCPKTASVADAARLMRDRDIGDVLIIDDGQLAGIVTDRDLVVRCLADGGGPDSEIGQACSSNVTTIPSDFTLEQAAQVMRDQALRRLPVVDQGEAVGIVSIGDLAVEQDPNSALGGISAERPNN